MRTIVERAGIAHTDSPVFASLRRTGLEDRARAMAAGRDWFRIVNRTNGRQGGGTTYAEVYIYDEIGYYGITAGQFVAELGELDVDEIDLHLNSPGGEVWDGIAIYNALVSHRAKVIAYCDGIAASAASVIFMAGDERVMAQGSQLMIHDAWGLCVGNAQDMQSMADRLDAESNNIAGFYSKRSGGSVAQWRKAMLAETWYSDDEAVTAGLAERVQKSQRAGAEDESPAARWDLSIFGFRYAGRGQAPAPTPEGGEYPDPGTSPVLRPAAALPTTTAPTFAVPHGPGPHNPPLEDAPAPDPDPVPETPDPDDELLELAGAMGASFAAAVTEATTDDFAVDGLELAGIIGHEATHRPADPISPAPAGVEPSAGEYAAAEHIANALLGMEAI